MVLYVGGEYLQAIITIYVYLTDKCMCVRACLRSCVCVCDELVHVSTLQEVRNALQMIAGGGLVVVVVLEPIMHHASPVEQLCSPNICQML